MGNRVIIGGMRQKILVFENLQSFSMAMYIEPWGHAYEIESGSFVEIEIEDDIERHTKEDFTIEQTEKSITIWPPDCKAVTLYVNNRYLDEL